jgi:hypothetical protein
MLSLTLEQVDDLKNKIEECIQKTTYWSSTTPKDQFLLDLKEI